MAGCESCYYLSPKVGTKGPEDSPFMVIGESPGINEVSQGIPFVGNSGKLLHEALQRAGVDDLPFEPYFTNAIQCLPRQKDPKNLAAACIQCRPRLLKEIRAHPRKVILALGGPAIQSLTGDYSLKITRERGKLFESELAEIGIVTAVHPAFLLRGSGNYTQFQRDIDYAVSLVKEGNQARKLPNGTSYHVIESIEERDQFIEVLKSLPNGSHLGCDIETTGLNHQVDKILALGIHYENKKSMIIPEKFICDELLEFDHLVYTWHNGKFDCRFLRHHIGPSARVDDDTQLMSYALNERRGVHDLDQVSSDWLGSANHKGLVDEFYKGFVIDQETGLKRRRNLSDAPPELVWKYLALDISDTYHLQEVLKPKVQEDPKLWRFYTQHLIPGSEYLLKLELNGMLVDDSWVLKNHYRLTGEIERLKGELQVWADKFNLVDFNPNSWQQVKKLLYNGLKLAPDSWSTDDDSLEKLPKHPAVTTLQKFRKVSKAHGTYVKPLIHGDNRVELLPTSKKETMVYPDGRTHSSYLLHGTPTSRLACRDPNVQNIPRDPLLRGQFIARPGYGILECDYSQAELRSLAALSKCESLMQIFIDDLSLHDEFSAYLFGEHFTKEEKMAAKTVNFGIPYGREAPSIAADPDLNAKMDVTVKLAQSWIDGWATRFPGAWEFIQKCRMAPARNQTMVTLFGNKKRPGVVSKEKLRDLQNESANFPHQSTASNLTIRSGIELIDVLRDDYDTHIINTVHDCLVMEVPLNVPHIMKVAKVVTDKMSEIPTRFPALNIIPWKSSAEFGLHWGNLVDIDLIANQSDCYLKSMPHHIAPH